MEQELKYIENLKTDKSLFNEKFSQLQKYYTLKPEDEIYEFIRKNEGILVLLDAVKPYLNKYFPNDQYLLEMEYDPEITGFVQLVLQINVNRERFHNGAADDLNEISSKFLPLRRKINVLYELLIMPVY